MEESGPNIRILNLAKALRGICSKIVVFHLGDESFVYDNIHIIGINSLKYVKKVWPTFLHLLFIQIPYSINLIKLLDKLGVDMVIVSESHTLGLFTSLMLLLARKFRLLKSLKLTILDKHNIYHSLIYEMLRIRNKMAIACKVVSYAIRFLELIECKLNDAIFVVSKKDAEHVLKHIGASKYLFVVPNVVEIPISSLDVGSMKERLGIASDQLVLLFIGGLNYSPNLDAVLLFLKKVFPKLVRHGNIVLLIVGKCGKSMVFELPNMCKVISTDYVKDITPYILASDLCIVPLRIGSGTRIKILTCMSYGKVVISTPKGAEGLDLMDGEDIIISDIDRFHEHILTIIKDKTLKEYIRRNARDTIKRKYSLNVLSRRLCAILSLLKHNLS